VKCHLLFMLRLDAPDSEHLRRRLPAIVLVCHALFPFLKVDTCFASTYFSKGSARRQHSPHTGENTRVTWRYMSHGMRIGGATFVAHITGSEPKRRQERRECEGFSFARRVAGATQVAVPRSPRLTLGAWSLSRVGIMTQGDTLTHDKESKH